MYERVLPNQCPTIPEAPPSHGETDTKPETLWVSFVFLVALHVAGLATVLYYAIVTPPTLAALGLCGVGFVATTFGISAGYHRLFSHGSYATGPVVKSVLLLLGAGAMQNSALEWARNHRLHHQYTDTDRDPYNAKRGFWYSHIKWVVEKTDHPDIDLSDLEADRVVSLQHRYYLPLAIVMAFVVPTLVGWFLGDAWGGLLLGGVVRLLLAYHATFSINSFAHWLGNQRYSSAHTARDSWWTALFTMGEGYHNFHHTFPGDYRNGVRFFDFDPPKWVLSAFAKWGWIWNVRRTPGHVIALRRLKQARVTLERNRQLRASERQALVSQADRLKQQLLDWSKISNSRAAAAAPRAVARDARREFWKAFHVWEQAVSST